MVVMKDSTHVPGKIYEYLATGKPIVAFSPPGGRSGPNTAGNRRWVEPGPGESRRDSIIARKAG